MSASYPGAPKTPKDLVADVQGYLQHKVDSRRAYVLEKFSNLGMFYSKIEATLIPATQKAKKQHTILADLVKRQEEDRPATTLLESALAADRRPALQNELVRFTPNSRVIGQATRTSQLRWPREQGPFEPMA